MFWIEQKLCNFSDILLYMFEHLFIQRLGLRQGQNTAPSEENAQDGGEAKRRNNIPSACRPGQEGVDPTDPMVHVRRRFEKVI